MVLNLLKEKDLEQTFFKQVMPESPFLKPNNCLEFFWLHLVPGITVEKIIKYIGSTWYLIRGLPVN
jgi:hypothetical protein